MAIHDASKSESARQEFVFTRVVNAPRQLVWDVYTKAEHLEHWWGPKGMALGVERLELHPGGTFLYSIGLPNGQKMYGKFVYREIAAPGKLVFVVSFTDAEGTPIRHPMSPTWPLEVLNTVTFKEAEGKTTIHMVGGPVNATAEEHDIYESNFEGMNKGFAGTMEQLDAYLATLVRG